MKIALKKKYHFSLLLLCLFNLSVHSNTYYVSPVGDNSNSGTENSPWLSLYYSVGQIAAGDTLILRGGTYKPTTTITINKNNVTLQNYPGETPVIDGQFKYPAGFDSPPAPGELGGVYDLWYAEKGYWYQSLIRITSDNVTIDGLTIQKSTALGVECEYGDNLIFKNGTLRYNFSAGIRLGKHGYGKNNSIINSTVHNNNYIRDAGVWKKWNSINNNVSVHGTGSVVRGCTIYFGPCAGVEDYIGTGTLIEDNTIYGNGFTQVHTAKSNATIIHNNLLYGAKRTAYTAEYDSSITTHSGYGAGLSIRCETWDNEAGWNDGHRIYNNLIANTTPSIHFGNEGKEGETYWQKHKITNCKFYNNTIVEPKQVVEHYNMPHVFRLRDEGHIGEGNEFKNNIFWQTPGRITEVIGYSGNIEFSSNLWNRDPGPDFKSSTDPTFPNYSNLQMSDYFPKATGWSDLLGGDLSPDDLKLLQTALYAINRGENLGAPYDVDYFNNQRPQSSAWDIGAHESSFATGLNEIQEQQEGISMEIYPNPSSAQNITLAYEIPKASDTMVQIFDVLGKPVETIRIADLHAGRHIKLIDTSNYNKGIYFCRVQAMDKTRVKRFVIQ